MKTDVLRQSSVDRAQHPVAGGMRARKSLKPRLFWRMGEPIPASLEWKLRVLSIVVPLALWWVAAAVEIAPAKFLPSPMDVANALAGLVEQGVFFGDLRASMMRLGIAVVLASVVSIPVGIAMGAFASVRSLLEPIVGVVRYMPATAFIPLLIIYLGLGESPKVALIFIGVIFFNTLMIMDAVKFVPKHLLEATYTMGGSRWQTLTQVIAPYVVPNIIDAFRINMAAAWNLLIVAEVIAANEGLGKRIVIAQKFFRTDEIFAYIIVLGVLGFLIDLALVWIQKTSCKWAVE